MKVVPRLFQRGTVLHTDDYYTGYYTGPIQLIDGLLDVTKKAVLAQIEWTEKFQVTHFYILCAVKEKITLHMRLAIV